jgi:quercetin dioxygenase-like cupin family protein
VSTVPVAKIPAPRARPTGRALVAACLAVAVTGCSGGSAAPSDADGSSGDLEPVSVVEHAAAELDGPVDVSVDGGTEGVQVAFRTITIAPGASTGEHCHYGQLVAAVTAGELTHYADVYPGGVHVYGPGDSIIEGAGYRHEGRNEGDEDVVLWVTYVTPGGKPLAETDLDHCD